MADFPTPPLFDAPARGNPLEFLDEITYLAKTRVMGLPYGEKFIGLIFNNVNRFFTDPPVWQTDRRTDDSI